MGDRIYFLSGDYGDNDEPNAAIVSFDVGAAEVRGDGMAEFFPVMAANMGVGYFDVDPISGQLVVASTRFYSYINPQNYGGYWQADGSVRLYDDTALFTANGDFSDPVELVHDQVYDGWGTSGYRGSEIVYPWSRYPGVNQAFFWGDQRVIVGSRYKPWEESDWSEGAVVNLYTDAGSLVSRSLPRTGVYTQAEWEQSNNYSYSRAVTTEAQISGLDRERGIFYLFQWWDVARYKTSDGSHEIAPSAFYTNNASGTYTAPTSAQLADPNMVYYQEGSTYWQLQRRQVFPDRRLYGACVGSDGKLWALVSSKLPFEGATPMNRPAPAPFPNSWLLLGYDPELLTYTSAVTPMPYGPGGYEGSANDYWSEFRTPSSIPQDQAVVASVTLAEANVVVCLPESEPRRDQSMHYSPGSWGMEFHGLAQSPYDPNVFYTAAYMMDEFSYTHPEYGPQNEYGLIAHFLKVNVATGESEIVGVDDRTTEDQGWQWHHQFLVGQIVVGPGDAPLIEDEYLGGRRRFW